MDRITVPSRVGADGVLSVSIPLGRNDANRSVLVIVEPVGETVKPDGEYHAWLNGLAGRWQGEFVRGDEGEFESREPLS